MIYNPLEEYDSQFKNLHAEKTRAFFDSLVARSGVDIEANRKTVKEHADLQATLKKSRSRLGWLRFLRVLMIITLVLIPLVILKTTPKIRALRVEIAEGERKSEELLALAREQMAPLNALFSESDALRIIEETIPDLDFAPCFSAEQEEDMIRNYDLPDRDDREQSAIEVLAGHYNENPFVFEKKLIHEMGVETYHGYKRITWTESYRGSDGKRHTRTRSETLHATVVKPKPFFRTRDVLTYCAQGGPDLSFSRDATDLDEKSEREIERYIKKGERKLKKMTDEAIRENRDFVSMSNTDFEVLFDALDRTDEVQFRTLFTPLAQTNMVDLIRSQSGFGDDFHFIKRKRTNRILTKHSQGRETTLLPTAYHSHDFDAIRDNFIDKNAAYFKAIYFDFAPLLAIPIYQERPVHSLDPLPDYAQKYASKECESLANRALPASVLHPRTKTRAILKSAFLGTENEGDRVRINAFSYDIQKRVDILPVYGGDGRWHNVHVPWDDYLPLERSTDFLVCTDGGDEGSAPVARRHDLCMFTHK